MIDAYAAGLSIRNLFPETPELEFQPDAVVCPCGGALKAYKTQRRTVVTMDIGEFQAVLNCRYCPECHKVFRPDELDRLVAPHCKFGFDVIEPEFPTIGSEVTSKISFIPYFCVFSQ